MIPLPRRLDFPFHASISTDQPTTSQQGSQAKTNISSNAVVDALRALQEKIRIQDLKTRKQAERCQQVSQNAQTHQQATVFDKTHGQAATLPLTYKQRQKETDDYTKFESLEACKLLQKQVEKTKKNIERTKKEHFTLVENQTLLQKEQLSSNFQMQNEKLEKLESEYQRLSRTQTLAQMKLAMLEEKLQKEEHERKLVQEKAEELQREFDSTLRIGTEQMNTKKKDKITKKSSRQHCEPKSPTLSRNSRMPFVAGTSTSPSHSVHANVQGILHMMKHHQPQLCERVGALHKPSCGAKKCLQKNFPQSNITVQRRHSEHSDAEESLGSLSDLLLALQDELGQMSFEHRELMHQIDDTHDHKKRLDLKNELEQLVTRMEDKGAQITKLRKHQQMVHKLTQTNQQAPYCEETHPPAPSPVKAQKKRKKQAPTQSNLQLLRETQQFRNSLKQSDLSWET